MPKSSLEGSSPRLRLLKLAWVYAAGLSVPFLLSVLWHSLNREYPKWDSLDYVNAALPVYRALKTYGWDSIGQVYWVRGWKPTLLPPLLLPFLLPTGDVRLSIALFNL